LGSGLLYLGLTFASAAIAGGMLTAYSLDPDFELQVPGQEWVKGRWSDP